MNVKKFAIAVSVFIGVIAIIMVTLGCIHINHGLDIDDPESFIIYTKSTVGKPVTYEDTPSRYKDINKQISNMTSLNIFDYMVKGISLNAGVGQDLSNQFEKDWNNQNKSDSYCVEMIFKEKQSIVVTVDGNTKVIEFYALIFELPDTNKASYIPVYFSNSTGTSKSYQSNPLVIVAKTGKLAKLIKAMQ